MRQAKDAEPWIQGNRTGGDDEKERGIPGPWRRSRWWQVWW
jgi:hypothetical protein